MIAMLGPAACSAAGAMLLARLDNRSAQWLGGGSLAAALLFASAPAHADQALTIEDNARVDCIASKSDLTRVSLVGDQFASVSKLQPDSPLDDFSIVNEPTRGDIYVSVPAGTRLKTLSFFGTSKKGYVYKFACRIEGSEAQQIFLTNPAASDETAAKAVLTEGDEDAPDTDETAVRLIQAMAEQKLAPGYHMEKSAHMPVKAGPLTVQLIAEYRGVELTGQVIRIENTGSAPAALSETQVAPAGAVAVAIANPRLEARQVTTAYVVLHRARASAFAASLPEGAR